MSSVAEERVNALVEGKPAVSYEELALVDTIVQLRKQPAVPEALRERVLAGPAPRARGAAWRARLAGLSWRRGMLVLAPACLALAVGGAVVAGLVSSGSPRERASGAGGYTVLGQSAVRQNAKEQWGSAQRAPGAGAPSPAHGRFVPATGAGLAQQVEQIPQALESTKATASSDAPLPPSGTRLQAYDAFLRVRVRGVGRLSNATKRAMRVARSLGGYVAFVNVNTAAQGDSALRLRVPVARVEDAVSRLSDLGTVLAQSFTVADLQRQANQQLDLISQLEGRIGRFQLTLADPSLSPERRARLQLTLSQLQHALKSNQVQHRATIRRGHLATITVTFTTRKAAAVPVKHRQPGRIHRAFSDAGSILARELAWTLYLLIVVAPLALLAALVIAATRFARRRNDRLVLEQT